MSRPPTSTHATQRNGWLWCALAAALFGAATPATKLVVDNIGAPLRWRACSISGQLPPSHHSRSVNNGQRPVVGTGEGCSSQSA